MLSSSMEHPESAYDHKKLEGHCAGLNGIGSSATTTKRVVILDQKSLSESIARTMSGHEEIPKCSHVQIIHDLPIQSVPTTQQDISSQQFHLQTNSTRPKSTAPKSAKPKSTQPTQPQQPQQPKQGKRGRPKGSKSAEKKTVEVKAIATKSSDGPPVVELQPVVESQSVDIKPTESKSVDTISVETNHESIAEPKSSVENFLVETNHTSMESTPTIEPAEPIESDSMIKMETKPVQPKPAKVWPTDLPVCCRPDLQHFGNLSHSPNGAESQQTPQEAAPPFKIDMSDESCKTKVIGWIRAILEASPKLLVSEQQLIAAAIKHNDDYYEHNERYLPQHLHILNLQRHSIFLHREAKARSLQQKAQSICTIEGCKKRKERGDKVCADHGGIAQCEVEGCAGRVLLDEKCFLHLDDERIIQLRKPELHDELDPNHFAVCPGRPAAVLHTVKFSELWNDFDMVSGASHTQVVNQLLEKNTPKPSLMSDMSRRMTTSLRTQYKRIIARLFAHCLESSETARTAPDEVTDELVVLPPGWKWTTGMKKRGCKIANPDDTQTFTNIDTAISHASPSRIISTCRMPLSDFYFLFCDFIPSNMKRAFRASVESGSTDYDYTIVLKNYVHIKKALGLSAVRTKLSIDSYVISCLPMIIKYDIETSSFQCKADTRYLLFKQLPKCILSLLPHQMHTPLDSGPSAKKAKHK